MKQSINLASGKKNVDSALRKVFIASFSLFCFMVIISFSLIIYRLFLKNLYDTLEQKEQKLNQQILLASDKRDKFIETKVRLDNIRKILQRRLPMSSRVGSLNEIIPEDVNVESISGTDIDIQVSIESENLSTLNELMEQKITSIAQDKKRRIKKIQVQSFGLNPKTLKYSMTFVITFS